jgi:hypothetical protein
MTLPVARDLAQDKPRDALSLYRRSRPTAGGCRKGALSAVDPEAG